MEITPEMVKALRGKTGLPIMECKQALKEAGGDQDKAIGLLRKKGLGQVGKRADRQTSEGRVACYLDPETHRAGIAELLCETAPVANTADFIKLTWQIARHAAQMDAPTPESILAQPLLDDSSKTLQDLMHEALNRLRENVRVAHVGSLSGHLGHYQHHNGQVGVLVELSADCPQEVKANVCMHIAAMRPLCTRREEVDPKLVAAEREIAAAQAKGKPENIVEKIVAGKLNRWYSEMVLLEQPFVKEDKKSVAQMLMAVVPELTVKRFLRFEVGQP